MSSPPLNDRHLPKFVRGLDNGDFLFLKIFQNFQKVQLEGYFIITSSYLNRKNKNIRRSSSHKVQRHSFFKKKIDEIFFKDKDSSNFTGGLDKGEDWTASNTVLICKRFIDLIALLVNNMIVLSYMETHSKNRIGTNYMILLNHCKISFY